MSLSVVAYLIKLWVLIQLKNQTSLSDVGAIIMSGSNSLGFYVSVMKKKMFHLGLKKVRLNLSLNQSVALW